MQSQQDTLLHYHLANPYNAPGKFHLIIFGQQQNKQPSPKPLLKKDQKAQVINKQFNDVYKSKNKS